MTSNYLDNIMMRKRKEVDALLEHVYSSQDHPLDVILRQERTHTHRFSKAVSSPGLSIIAEVKRRSPSRGDIGSINDPTTLAHKYCQGGASAVSVLTDGASFGGSLDDLRVISKEIHNVPTLRKDFIIHPIQLAEAVLAGASAVLLIACSLGPKLRGLLRDASRFGLEVLTEVHDEIDLEYALDAGATIIGVNNRNLQTFEIDLNTSVNLRKKIPPHMIAVSESGIHTPEQAKRMSDIGFDAILVGEALVTSNDCAKLIKKMRGVPHEG